MSNTFFVVSLFAVLFWTQLNFAGDLTIYKADRGQEAVGRGFMGNMGLYTEVMGNIGLSQEITGNMFDPWAS